MKTYADFLNSFYKNPALAGSMLKSFDNLQNQDYRRALADFYRQVSVKLDMKMEEDRDVCLASFKVKDRSLAKVLMDFVEKVLLKLLRKDIIK